MSRGSLEWKNSAPQSWDHEMRRFYQLLAELDGLRASEETIQAPMERLFQGPIADALTHVGQIAMMRRMAGLPMRGENYFVARDRSRTRSVMSRSPRRENSCNLLGGRLLAHPFHHRKSCSKSRTPP